MRLTSSREMRSARRSFRMTCGVNVGLVRRFLPGLETQEFVRDDHGRRTTRCANNHFRHVGGRRVRRLHIRTPPRATATPRIPAMAATMTKPPVDSPRTATVIVAEAFAFIGPAVYIVAI